MKNKLSKIIFISLLGIITFTSCSTTKNSRENDPNYLGNFDPFYIGNVMCLTSTTFNNTKPATIDLYFAPRTNTIQSQFKDGMNNVCLMWTPEQCELLMKSIEEYIIAYNGDTKLENRKPKAKNAFETGKIEIYWGLGGYTRNTLANYYTNYEYLEENKPFFKINVSATPYPEEEHVSSPTVELYFSPSQLENLVATTDYSLIMEQLEQLQKEAYEW